MKRRRMLIVPMILLAGCGVFGSKRGSDVGAQAERPGSAAPSPVAAKTVTEAQQALKEAGFDPGAPDGVLGPQTRQAIRDFQRDRGLRVTGDLDPATRQALVKASAKSGG